MHGRSEVVKKARQGELESSCGASRLRLGFEDVYLPSVLSKSDGRGETVGTGTDDAGLAGHLRYSL
jgi:hypothetical protein